MKGGSEILLADVYSEGELTSQKAHKALAEKYGSVIGKTPEQIQSEMREEIAKVKIEFPKLDGLIKNNQ